MKVVRNKVTQVVVYAFNDSDPCVITDSGMTGVVNAADIFSATHEVIEGVSVPENWTGNEWMYDGHWFRNGTTPTAPIPPKLTPVQFKMCFTPQERIGIKTVRETDPVLQDAYEILDDPRLTEVDLTLASVQGLIDYLGALNLMTSERIEQVKAGVVL